MIDPRLARFCSKDRASLLTPFLVHANEQGYACASNGRRLLALPASACPEAKAASLSAQVATMLESLVPVGVVDLSVLASFCGAPTTLWTPCSRCDAGEVECPECDGNSEVRCECSCGHQHTTECPQCRGRARVVCPHCNAFRKTGVRSRTVVIGDVHFDAGLVAGAIVDAEKQSGTAEWCNYAKGEMHALRGADWILLLAPMWVDATATSSYPRLVLGDLNSVGAA